MNRRNLLKSLILVPAAPAIVKAENIMRVVVPKYGLQSDGSLLFDGTSSYLKPYPFDLSAPNTLYVLCKHIVYKDMQKGFEGYSFVKDGNFYRSVPPAGFTN